MQTVQDIVRTVLALIIGAAAMVIASRISIPLPVSPISFSAQSLLVVIVGGLLGPWRALLAVGIYIAMGLAGLPVFQHGGAGMAHFSGPTGGFLVGFLPAAAFMGYWTAKGQSKLLTGLFTGAFLTHIIIFGCGWIRLSALYGGGQAWTLGVRPFLDGAMFKTVLATAILFGLSRLKSLPWLGRAKRA